MAAENPPTHHDQDPAPRDRNDTLDREFAQRWASAAFGASTGDPAAKSVQEVLCRFTEELRATLAQELFSPDLARVIGVRLVDELPASPAVLEASIHLLCKDFRSTLEIPDGPSTSERISALIGAFAAGYSEALRDHGAAEREFTTLAVVDELDRAEASLEASLRRFRTVFESAGMGIVIANLDGLVQQTNPALSRILHYREDEFRQRPLASFLHQDDIDTVRAEYDRLAQGKIDWYRADIRLIRRDGDPVWVQITASLVRDPHGNPAYWITLVENLTDTKMLVRSLTHQSLHDELTGLPNRAQFLRRLETILAAQDRPERLALWYLDLDGFKVVNDSLGHDAGDEVIRTIAERLHHVLDEDMLVARVGGDEFAGLIQGARCGSELEKFLNKILDEIGRVIHSGHHEISMSASVGVVDRDTAGLTAAELLRAANLTLHWAKSDGKGQWTPYDEERNRRDRDRFRLAVELPSALRDGEFALTLQPVISLADGAPVAVNALVHWDHPVRGLLPNSDFLDIAAQTGLAVPLGRWTLRAACRAAGGAQRAVADRLEPPVSVRLSRRQAKDQDLVRDVLQAIEDAGVASSRLHVRLAAGDLLGDDNDDVREAASVLAELGVGVIVADFGARPLPATGFGDLSITAVELAPGYLTARGVREDPGGEDWFARLITAAHRYADTVIVGEVSEPNEVALLRRTGADAAFGPHFGAAGATFDIAVSAFDSASSSPAAAPSAPGTTKADTTTSGTPPVAADR